MVKNKKNNLLIVVMFLLATGMMFFLYAVVGYIMGLYNSIITIRGHELPLVTAKVFFISIGISLLIFIMTYFLIRISRIKN